MSAWKLLSSHAKNHVWDKTGEALRREFELALADIVGADVDVETVARDMQDKGRDREWLNVDTGARVLLVIQGGWRTAQRYPKTVPAKLRVFYAAPAAGADHVEEITDTLLPNGAGEFDRGTAGLDSNTTIVPDVVEKITAWLG